MTEPVVVDITGTKKIVVLSIVGAIIVLAGVAQFIPEVRAYTIDIVKVLIAFIPAFVK